MQIHSDRWGRRAREAGGIDPHGTIRLATIGAEEKWLDFSVVPCGQVPYYPVLPADLADEDGLEQQRWIKSPALGWRHLLQSSVSGGVLRPDPELMRLIGLTPWTIVIPSLGWSKPADDLNPASSPADPYSPNYRRQNLDWV